MLLQETLKLHDQNKYEFHYIYFLPWKNQMVEGIESAGGKVNLFSARNNVFIMLKVFSVIRYIKSEKIELVHCHLPWAGFLGRLIFKLTKIPVIYTEHNIQDRYHKITKVINKITFNWQRRVIAVSNDVAASIQQSVHPRIPVQTILNGVNTEAFCRNNDDGLSKRKEYGIDEKSILIGTIAVFRFQKRLKEWISIFKKIHEQFPHVKGVIIGDGPLKDEIMEHLHKENMEQHILFPGLQPNVKPWLSAMDIFMMSSSFEGLPIALLEAMSMECAVVCTSAGGIKEVIRNGKDGFTEPVDLWQELEKPLGYLVQNISEIRSFGNKARTRVQESFSVRKMVEETEWVYATELSKK